MNTPMRITDYIAELLYEHDCVVIPGFGAFIGNYAPAKADTIKHLFTPPFKRIIFNEELTGNDGVLANYITQKNNITYNSALKIAVDEGHFYRAELKKEKKLSLDNIGELYYDERQKLIFRQDESVNYLPESTGLASFYRLPVERVPSIPAQEEIKQKRASNVIPYSIAAILIVSFCLLAYSFLQLAHNGNSYSGFNFLSKGAARKYSLETDNTIDTLTKKIVPPAFNTEMSRKDAESAKARATEPSDEHTMSRKDAKLAKAASDTAYSIVAGCFKIRANADKLIQDLHKKGIDASVIGKRESGMWLVGFGKFNTKYNAESRLEEFRNKVEREAWLIEKRKI